MFQGEYNFNLWDMRGDHGDFMHEYMEAYPYTNEPIEKLLTNFPIAHPRVLTVAASGDQPLLYAANGASHIDTFDRTINACVVMDFKTTALKMNLKYEDYMYLVNNLHILSNDHDYRPPNLPIKLFNKIVKHMPYRTRELMRSFATPAFGMVIRGCCYQISRTAQTSPELYQKMQSARHAPFNFIWADLVHLSQYIDGKYDIIYLSNIFDHYLHNRDGYRPIWKSLRRLWPHLNAGGYILCTTSKKLNYPIYALFKSGGYAINILPTNVSIKCTQDTNWSKIIIQKTR